MFNNFSLESESGLYVERAIYFIICMHFVYVVEDFITLN